MTTLGIFGFGYTAQAFARLATSSGYKVYGISRSEDIRQQFNSSDLTLVDFNLAGAKTLLSHCESILITVPPNAQELDPVLHHFKKLLIKNTNHLNWLGYLSTTGVYGDHKGRWVTEESASIDPGASGVLRLRAEQAWLNLLRQDQLPVHVFRVAGIYGPGRSSIDRIAEKNHTIYKPDQVFSRIHIDDLCQALMLSLNNPKPGEVYNICDDVPAPSSEVDQYAAKILNRPTLKLLHYENAKLSPMGLEFYRCNKRVSNAKIKKELNFKPKYPSYREGLDNLNSTL